MLGMRRLFSFYLSALAVAAIPVQCGAQERQKQMNGQDTLLATASKPEQPFRDRIEALETLSLSGSPGLVPRLLEVFNRQRQAGPKAINWDPQAAERVIDLYIILALFRCGDASLLPQIPVIVSRAGNVLKGPDNELENAAKVIKAMGRLEPIQQLVGLSGDSRPQVVANAIRTLQMLELPSQPTGGPLTFPELDSPVSFTIHYLGEELDAISRLSHGRIKLSPGVQERATHHDFERGEVRREDTTLADVLTMELDMLDFTYAVTPRAIVICTFYEAGVLWQKWLPDHAADLNYRLGQ